MTQVLIGVAGWSYEDWKGVVYPRGCKDPLRYLAGFVDLLEVNSTFYRPPVAEYCRRWVERTAELGTAFTAKLPQEFTHRGRSDAELVAQTREGFQPLLESGRLLALLAQFNYRFQVEDEALRHLAVLAGAFGGDVPLVVELRHRSWNEADALRRVRDLGLSVANLDYPGAVRGGFDRDVTGVNGAAGLAYFRLHGRNAAAWFSKEAGRDQVYDYEYSSSEVERVVERMTRIVEDAEKALVVANNHFEGKAVKLALQLIASHRQRKIQVPDALLAAYPDLQSIARGWLF